MTRGPLCQFCGAWSPKSCELEESAGVCLWEELDEDGSDEIEEADEE